MPTYSVASIFRPGQIFFRWYGKHYARVLDCFTHFFVQNVRSKDLLEAGGWHQVSVVGDTRFDRVLEIRHQAKDVPVAEAFASAQTNEGHVLVAGSTWSPDEDILISYFNAHPEERLILAPHVVSEAHLAEIEHKLQRPSLRFTQATAEKAKEADCLIIDCYGLLSSIYRYGQIAYVGGGFGVGIHNVPEAAVYGIPVIIGPNNKNFREVQDLIAEGGTFEIKSADEYATLMKRLADDPQLLCEGGAAAQAYIQKGAGAVDKIFDAVFGSHDQ